MGYPRDTPQIPLEIVEWAERLFPDRCPSLEDPDRKVWYLAGQASVARKLRQEYEAQTPRLLEAMNQ
jgi:hypothetical protein